MRWKIDNALPRTRVFFLSSLFVGSEVSSLRATSEDAFEGYNESVCMQAGDISFDRPS